MTLEHMKRLEGEVLDQLHAFGDIATARLEAEGLTVDPHQFLGLELNPRAAAIAELVLWIGYLQWHFRTQGTGLPPQPILKRFQERRMPRRRARVGQRQLRRRRDRLQPSRAGTAMHDQAAPGDRRTSARRNGAHPARTLLRKSASGQWPQADFIVGNPPFIGNKRMRDALGDGYVEALRGAWKKCRIRPISSCIGGTRREARTPNIGFAASVSSRQTAAQTFNRRVPVEAAPQCQTGAPRVALRNSGSSVGRQHQRRGMCALP